MIKAAIFDLDGTLADTLPDILTAINGICELRSIPTVDEAFVLKFINGDTEEFVRSSVPGIPESEIPEWVEQYKQIYAKCYLDKTHEYAGMTGVLRALRERGVKLAVFSNKADEAVKNLAKKLFPGLFDFALGAGIYKSKPNAEGALAILDSFGVKPCEAVFIGDSDVDVNTAKNAGIRAIGVSWGYRGHTFLEALGGCDVVDTMDELLKNILENN